VVYTQHIERVRFSLEWLRFFEQNGLASFCKNDMNLAAEERIDDLFPLPACRPLGSFLRAPEIGFSRPRAASPM
jgi:hypothetical protein